MRILIIEDNPDIAGNLGDYLEARGHDVDYAQDGKVGLHLAVEHNFEIIILDINLPYINGFTLCQKLRQEQQVHTPVLILSARGELSDKLQGFAAGAWDYVVKPFALAEIEVRVEALLMRQQSRQASQLSLGSLILDTDNWQASRDGVVLHLHQACLRILEVLMRASPNVVARRDLEYALWGETPPESNPLRSHLYELRKNLDKPFDKKMLLTVHGIGYRLLADD